MRYVRKRTTQIYQAPDIGLNVSVNEALLMALLNRKNHLEKVTRLTQAQRPEERGHTSAM